MNRQTVTAAARQSWPKQPMYRVRNFGQGSLDMNGKLQFQWRKTTSVGLAATGCCSAAQDPTRFPSSLRRDVVSLALLRGVRLVPLRKGNKTDRESTRAKRATRIWWWFCKVCTAARLVGLWQQAGGERDRERERLSQEKDLWSLPSHFTSTAAAAAAEATNECESTTNGLAGCHLRFHSFTRFFTQSSSPVTAVPAVPLPVSPADRADEAAVERADGDWSLELQETADGTTLLAQLSQESGRVRQTQVVRLRA